MIVTLFGSRASVKIRPALGKDWYPAERIASVSVRERRRDRLGFRYERLS